MREIYLDNSATTKMRAEALEEYARIATEIYGNPSSLHQMGLVAEKLLDRARADILGSIDGKECQLIFTSSGTEANNLAIFGRALAKERFRHGSKVIATDGEHASVKEPLEMLRSMGYKIAYIPTNGGSLDYEALEQELTPDVILVTMMMVNNETGAVYPIPRVAKMIKSKCPEALLHVDATQGYMKIPFRYQVLGADMITLSSHKIGGPKGVGALCVSSSVLKSRGIRSITLGGGQEGGLRSGTENVPGICAFGVAARLAAASLSEDIKVMEELRSYLITRLTTDEKLKEIRPTLPPFHAPHILNITLPSIKSETMLHFLSSMGVYVSSGSACSSNSSHSSPALIAYGHTTEEADHSIRISFCSTNCKEDVDALCDALVIGLERLARVK